MNLFSSSGIQSRIERFRRNSIQTPKRPETDSRLRLRSATITVDSKVTVHRTVKFFFEVNFCGRKKSKKFGSDTKLTWDGGGFRVCAGDFVELGKDMREKERYDRKLQPES